MDKNLNIENLEQKGFVFSVLSTGELEADYPVNTSSDDELSDVWEYIASHKNEIIISIQQRNHLSFYDVGRNENSEPHTTSKAAKVSKATEGSFSSLLKEGSLPSAWERVLTTLLHREKPQGVTQQKWDSILHQINLLLGTNSAHLMDMIKHNWSLKNIFGCHKIHPQQRYDAMGLLMLLQGREIEEVKKDCIILRTPSGDKQALRKPVLTCQEEEQSTLYEIELDEDLKPQISAEVAEVLSTDNNPEHHTPPNVLTDDRGAIRLEPYVSLYKARLPVHRSKGLSEEEADWKAKNDVVLQFIEDTGFSQCSFKVRTFIEHMSEETGFQNSPQDSDAQNDTHVVSRPLPLIRDLLYPEQEENQWVQRLSVPPEGGEICEWYERE